MKRENKRELREDKRSKPLSKDKTTPSKYEIGMPEDVRVIHNGEADPDDG